MKHRYTVIVFINGHAQRVRKYRKLRTAVKRALVFINAGFPAQVIR